MDKQSAHARHFWLSATCDECMAELRESLRRFNDMLPSCANLAEAFRAREQETPT